MAKGQVSEEELAKGLKGIGNFTGLSAPRVRRDNPFRDSRSETPVPEPVKTIEVKVLTPEPVPAERPAKTPEKRESKPAPRVVPKLEPKPVKRLPAKVPVKEEKPEANGVRKADIFTERVTLQISPEMRDDVERIARELQRAKSSKKERITGNTVMRVAIRLITKHFELEAGEAPNDEEELFTLVQKAFGRRGG